MDSWLKAAKEQAQKLGEEVQKQASQLAADAPTGRRELSFKQGDLGFEVNGVYVKAVEPDGQAHRLGVLVGDRIISIAGYVIPSTPAAGAVERWLEEMIRPGRIVFLTEEPADAPAAAAAAVSFPTETDFADTGLHDIGDSALDDLPSAFAIAEELELDDSLTIPQFDKPLLDDELDGEARLRAQLLLAQDQIDSLERELEDCRAECQGLRHIAAETTGDGMVAVQSKDETRLQRLQEQLAIAKRETEAARKRARDAQVQLESVTAKCEELRAASAQSEDRAMEALEGREQVLEEELSRLRETLHIVKMDNQSSIRSAQQDMRAAQDRTEELEKRFAQISQENRELQRMLQDSVAKAASAEAEAAATTAEIVRLRHEHNVDVAEVRASHDREQERRADLDKADEAGDGQEEEENDIIVKTAPLADEALSAHSGAADSCSAEDAAQMRERLQYLEARCCTLQNKLSARPIVYQSPVARKGTARLPRVVRDGWWGIADTFLVIAETALRNFTDQLLRRDAWLWVFYVHLLILYAIAASCYYSTGGVSSTVDVDLHSKQSALRGTAAPASST
eukprot:TRINITY_DN25996_c0_g1_i2.p1 TRINITY_DN25996_c0_g1~~TRINITY_DN25996_c0_g1_i2.p1  ORF type:complete len:579 (-),score=163.95 TRINITY_DN25996_c0_g1_i2:52-1758(-)